MASKRRSFISLIFIINCITKCSLIRNLQFKRKTNEIKKVLELFFCT